MDFVNSKTAFALVFFCLLISSEAQRRTQYGNGNEDDMVVFQNATERIIRHLHHVAHNSTEKGLIKTVAQFGAADETENAISVGDDFAGSAARALDDKLTDVVTGVLGGVANLL
ncbi:hypothetical protein HNY73_003092 [Argiope bruennichi]|uniref:Uncharacterized protein n=1 Tax=Argiope bruennichi TaxID=94029 RepID=A0A8T0G079_ARGBR|nr:hypothetical protein HNY73_003092 [Argiope bruennichi]